MQDRSLPAMPDRVDKLRQCIARFERLLRDEANPEVARVYAAELAADRVWLAAIG